ADADGQKGHGLSRLPSYAAQAASGKVDGFAEPTVVQESAAAVRIDAACGFAFPAMDLALDRVAEHARCAAIGSAGVFRSHQFGQAGLHLERPAERGSVARGFGNCPRSIAPWGGSAGLYGTTPIAFAAPRTDDPPLVIDLPLSKVA